MSTTLAPDSTQLSLIADQIEVQVACQGLLGGANQIEVTDLWSTYNDEELEELYSILRGRGYKMATFIGETNQPVLLLCW